jgi:uroporphyrinogen-III decarboxylase
LPEFYALCIVTNNLSPGGGFIFQHLHNIMANVPLENILTMYAAVSEFKGKSGN